MFCIQTFCKHFHLNTVNRKAKTKSKKENKKKKRNTKHRLEN